MRRPLGRSHGVQGDRGQRRYAPRVVSHPSPSSALLHAFAALVRANIARSLERENAASVELRARVIPAVAAGVERVRREELIGDAWLFGSFAWGRPGERSDVDVLVEQCRDPDRVASILAELCARDVHVVPREQAPEGLVKRAIAEGLPL